MAAAGFEPATSCLPSRRLYQLGHAAMVTVELDQKVFNRPNFTGLKKGRFMHKNAIKRSLKKYTPPPWKKCVLFR